MQQIMQYFMLLLKGFFMGAANVVPGVSGGTIAFITGIYEKLIDSIHSIDLYTIKLFFRGRWKQLYHRINGGFLLILFIGIIGATLSLAELMKYLLENYPTGLWAFFFGLILASAVVILKRNQRWTTGTVLSLIIGGVIAYFITTIPFVETPNTWPYLLLIGAIAMSTMILPGVSGSYVLVIVDKYNYIITLVSGINEGAQKLFVALLTGHWGQIPDIWDSMTILPLFIFLVGAIVGLIAFAKLLNYFLERFHDLTVTFLTGFMIGSLNKIWPWKKTLEWYETGKGTKKPLEQVNMLPPDYNTSFFIAVGLALVGFIVVYLIEMTAQSQNN